MVVKLVNNRLAVGIKNEMMRSLRSIATKMRLDYEHNLFSVAG